MATHIFWGYAFWSHDDYLAFKPLITNLRHRFLYPHGPLHSHSLWGAARGLPSITPSPALLEEIPNRSSWLRQKPFNSAKGTFYDEQSHQFARVLFLRWFGKFSENVQVFFQKMFIGVPSHFWLGMGAMAWSTDCRKWVMHDSMRLEKCGNSPAIWHLGATQR